jgi:hypothetical protein
MKSQFIGALALFSLMNGAATASTFTIDYFTAPETGSADFGTCCSSPPATLPNITPGSSLVGGLPVTSTGGTYDVQMVSNTGQILWWTPSTTTGITAQGSSPVNLPYTNNFFFSPQGTGPDNASVFQTAILSGTFQGNGSDVKLTVTSDDDALVYLNGMYFGGNPGVHGAETSILDFGDLSGTNSLEIFYADRAQVAAVFDVALSGAAPEPATWAMMILGFFGVGFMAYRRKNQSTLRLA